MDKKEGVKVMLRKNYINGGSILPSYVLSKDGIFRCEVFDIELARIKKQELEMEDLKNVLS